MLEFEICKLEYKYGIERPSDHVKNSIQPTKTPCLSTLVETSRLTSEETNFLQTFCGDN